MVIKKMRLGPIVLMIGMGEKAAEHIRRNRIYCYLIRPIRNFLARKNVFPRNTGPNKEIKKQEEAGVVDKKFLNNHQADAATRTPEQRAILRRIKDLDWYHSIDLGNGISTPGRFNHNPQLAEYHLPERLDGLRVLDVATFDGFWAFEFERKGAAEVVALDVETWNDLDLPPSLRTTLSAEILKQKTGRGFEIAKEILGSAVQRNILSVYSLSPDRFGRFDMVFCSDLLIHLMNPMKALQNICSVASGFALITEPFNPELNLFSTYEEVMYYKGGSNVCTWWNFSLKALERMIRDAGFKKVELVNTFELRLPGRPDNSWHAVFKASSLNSTEL